MQSIFPTLPIDQLKDDIVQTMDQYSNLILKATPGSGKTTRVPLYLLDLLKAPSQKIYVLEPRRLAAKLAAHQVARNLGEKVGQSVGYIFRYEKMVGPNSRIIFLTEGTFLKIMSQNTELNDTAVVIIDEFHERHLSTDASLGFVIKLQKEKRPDLKIIVMSATLETENLSEYLNRSAPTRTLELSASRFPLALHFLPNTTSIVNAPLSKKIRDAVERAIEEDLPGDILVFLPGMREIKEAQSALFNLCEHHHIECLILHGDLEASEQDHVLRPHEKRKIILSTNIAESSVTIEGTRIVIDSGLQRESSYNFYSGLPELKVTKISRAQATQRAGRSNRQSAGVCFRLYAELDHDQRPYLHRPEILKSDLSELYLMSLHLFKAPLESLPWFESPPESALKNARELLEIINAMNDGSITDIGKRMLDFPLHPRLARIMVEAELYDSMVSSNLVRFIADFAGEKNTDRLKRSLPPMKFQNKGKVEIEQLLLFGFPDRIARARGGHFFDVVTRNGETLKIAKEIADQFDPAHELWVVMDLNNKGEASKIIAIEELLVYDLEPCIIEEDVLYEWDEKKERMMKFERTFIGKIVLSESRSEARVLSEKGKSILATMARNFLLELSHSQEYERLMTLNKIELQIEIQDHLFSLDAFLSERTSFNAEDKSELRSLYFQELKDLVDPNGTYNLEVDLPLVMSLSDKRKVAIHYDRAHSPSIESYIQDFYGLIKTPVLAKGKVPLTVKLLGPHKLAMQVTQDLESFWSKTYPSMVVALKRDYPRHYWPDDPKSARPILLKRQVPQV